MADTLLIFCPAENYENERLIINGYDDGMGVQHTTENQHLLAKNFLTKLDADMKNEEIHPLKVVFQNLSLENDYQKSLVKEIRTQRQVAMLMITIYCMYGLLDIVTIKENLNAVLAARFLVGAPILFGLLALLFIRKIYERFLWHIISAGLATMVLSIIFMISQISPREGPPYIIGVLVVFIFSACIPKIPFRFAALVYFFATIIYGCVLCFGSQFSEVDRISGLAFLVAIAIVSTVTHYLQDVRSRLIWKRDRQRLEDAALIQDLLLEATAADQSKISFISLLTHELRTPVHQIIGFAEVLGTQAKNRNYRDVDMCIEQILTSGHGLLSRISKMLRYADATAGKIEYCPEPVSVDEMIDTVCAQLADRLKEKQITVNRVNFEPCKVYTDHQYTIYALVNLFENAIAASSQASELQVSCINDGEERCFVEIIDSGCGMSEEDLNNALQPFSQTESVRTRTIEGIGLGLTLSRKILIDQGTTFSINSALGSGTTVHLGFPKPKKLDHTTAKKAA